MITASQIKAARALIGVDQRQLAQASGLSLPTMSWIAVPVAGAWLGVALAMGRAATVRQREAA